MGVKDGLYARSGGENGTYNNNFVTKLLKNFRSHPEILEVPNQRFYEFELQPCADKQEREKFCGWKVRLLSLEVHNHSLYSLTILQPSNTYTAIHSGFC